MHILLTITYIKIRLDLSAMAKQHPALERVQKILASSGVDSRRNCEELIRQGRVTVNGKIAIIGDSANRKTDVICVDETPIKLIHQSVYLMLNKPRGVITSVTDPFNRSTVMDFIPPSMHVFPIGRLDRDAEGLLLLTNDGEFANKIMHPRFMIDKVYEAKLDRALTHHDREQLLKGVKTDVGFIRPTRLEQHGKQVEVTVHQGMNKVVKRMFDALEFHVASLRRIQVGKLRIGPLKIGRFRHLTRTEVEMLKQQTAAPARPVPPPYQRRSQPADTSYKPTPSTTPRTFRMRPRN